MAEDNEKLKIIKNYSELANSLENDIMYVILHLEGAAAIKKDLSNLERYYRRGVRSIGLVWSRPNQFGCGVPYRYPSSPDTGEGLTAAGLKLVDKCNSLGILIDLSHINEKGFWDVAKRSKNPLIVSHTGVHSICPSSRNLKDPQLKEIGDSDGLVGVYFSPTNIRSDGKRKADTELSDIVDHIVYIRDLIGIDHVALGSDFDGSMTPDSLSDAGCLPNLIEELDKFSFSKEEIEKISYKNWLRILKNIWH